MTEQRKPLTTTIYFNRQGAECAPTDKDAQPKYVGEGAVRQDGSLKLMRCQCGQDVVWATSKRTQRKYRVNVSRGASGARFYAKRNVHKCDEYRAYMAQFAEADDRRTEGAALVDAMDLLQRTHAAGKLTDDEYREAMLALANND